MGKPIDDTATAPERPGSVSREVPVRLGRYRIERVIGQGGMGVVYAALDPDLERRVALKVLRTEATGDDSRARMLREARAMAKLQHPNVVMVHEVGTAGDKVFVAMELVEGETLAEWLATPRREPEIVETFLAAGRGLAAAHAAGIVHRDFKPYNVLIGRGGRVQVTDFGLARGVEPMRADPMAKTLPPDARPVDLDATPSSLTGLTTTGVVLGTPAYMAPEQWVGGNVGPAADQFAYCVALWEALAGKRPFGGTTEDELRAEVLRGPLALDASKLPRRLRPVLLRGLEPKQAKRWPDMDALLHALRSAQRRPYRIVATLGGIVVVGGVIGWSVLHGGHAAPSCRAPAWDTANLRLGDTGAALGELGASIDRDLTTWSAARDRACTAEHGAPSIAQLDCLDSVLARVANVEAAAAAASRNTRDALELALVDPALCTSSTPHLVLAENHDVIAALGYAAGVLDADAATRDELATAAQQLADRPNVDVCARALALTAAAERAPDVIAHHTIDLEAASAAERCGDDHVRATVAIALARFELGQHALEASAELARRAAGIAIDRVPQSDLVALRDVLEAAAATDRDLDRAIALATKAIDAFAKRGGRVAQLYAGVVRTQLRRSRARPEDVEAIRDEAARWRAMAHDPRVLAVLDDAEAVARVVLGDLTGAHAMLDRVRARAPIVRDRVVHVSGTVVDAARHPVAGALVATAGMLMVDPMGLVPFGPALDLVTTTSDAAGHFQLDAPESGGIMAFSGELRSPPRDVAPALELALRPTRTLSGRIALGAVPATKVFATALANDRRIRYRLIAPVARDGSFTLVGAPVDALQLTTMVGLGFEAQNIAMSTPYPAGTGSASGIALAVATGGRHVVVIARSTLSTPLEQAVVVIAAGRVPHPAHLVDALAQEATQQLDRQQAHAVTTPPPGLAGTLKPGDLIGEFDNVAPGEDTACVVGLSRELMANGPGKMFEHASEIEVRCATVAPDATVVVVRAPPPQHFD